MNSTISENEIGNIIKVSLKTNVKKAVNYIFDIFTNNKYDTIQIIGLSQAISKLILITEVVKSKFNDLHQINHIDSVITKVRTPMISGSITRVKRTPKLAITLTRIEPTEKGVGYQKPICYDNLSLIEYLNNKKNQLRGRRVHRGPNFKVKRNTK